MMWLINILKKRPSDNTIRVLKIVLGLIIVIGGYYNLIYQNDAIQSSLFGIDVTENGQFYIKYAIISLGIVPILMGSLNMCLLKSKYMRITQIFVGILLFYISSIIVKGPKLDFDSLILFLGFFPLLGGITGKCITTKCQRHAEKITKIRV